MESTGRRTAGTVRSTVDRRQQSGTLGSVVVCAHGSVLCAAQAVSDGAEALVCMFLRNEHTRRSRVFSFEKSDFENVCPPLGAALPTILAATRTRARRDSRHASALFRVFLVELEPPLVCDEASLCILKQEDVFRCPENLRHAQ